MVGNILGGRYEILEVIGSGGMAIVYKARCRLLNRYVAVKVLREELRSDKDFVENFKNEARSAASLNHPNIVAVYDVGNEENLDYFVMEYIEGTTVKELIDAGKMDWKKACSYGLQIAAAIEHAHRKNIVHRDIKPHNIMVTKDNVVKVTDFGIARAVTSSTLVRAGNVMGSVHYFSPEQACGDPIDFKSDIYSMGVVLYEMLTGKVPFDAENPVAVAKMHTDSVPEPPAAINPSIPETVSDVVLKAMAKQPMKRYQTAGAFATDLKRVISNPDSIDIKDEDATQFVPVVKPDGNGYVPSDKIIIKGNDDEKDDTGRKSASKAAWIFTSLVFVLSVLIIAMAFNPGAMPWGDTVTVPELLGKTLDEAEKICEEAGFVLEEKDGDYSNKYSKGQIMEQTPESGNSKKVEKIVVRVSLGSAKVSLKDYEGEDFNEVKSELERLGIDVIIERTTDDDFPLDTVIKHSPSAGSTLKAGSSVTLYVSTGKEKTKVPSIKNMTLEDARRKLEDENLKLGEVTYSENAAMVNKVIEQSVTADTEVEIETEVSVVVGKAPQQSETTPVPPPSGPVNNDSGATSR